MEVRFARCAAAVLVLLAALGVALPASAVTAPKATHTIDVGTGPGDLAYDPTTSTLYAAHVGSGRVTATDVETGARRWEDAAVPGALGIAVDPGTHTLFVTSYNSSPGLVTAVDATNGAVLGTITVGAAPSGVAVDPGTHAVFVTSFNTNAVATIDGPTRTVTRTITIGANPSGITVEPATHLVLVAVQGADTLTTFDGRTGAIQGSTGVGSRPSRVAVDTTTRTRWVANGSGNSVTRVDAAGTVIDNILLGATPASIGVDARTAAAFVSASDGTVRVIEPSGQSSIALPSAAGVAVDPDHPRTFVATSDASTASVLESAPTTTAVTTSSPTATAGQPVTFRATVTPGDGGTVAFTSDGAPIAGCGAVPLTGRTAECTTTSLPAGDHRVRAAYSGTAGLSPSGADVPGTQKVQAASSSRTTAVGPGTPSTTAAPAPGTTTSAPTTSPVVAAPVPPPAETTTTTSTTEPPSVSSGVTGVELASSGVRRLPIAERRVGGVEVGDDAALRYIASVPDPSTALTLKEITRDALLAALLLLLLSAPVTLVNDTAEDNVERLRAGAARLLRRLHASRLAGVTGAGRPERRIPALVALAVAAAVSGVLYGFVEPSFSLNKGSGALVAGVTLALLVQNGAEQLSQVLYLGRVRRVKVAIGLFPGFLAVALACVGISRLTRLQPGLILGNLCGVRTPVEPDAEARGRAETIDHLTLVVIAVAAWFGRPWVIGVLGHPGSFVTSTVAVALTTLVVSCALGVAFEMIPLDVLPGSDVLRWSKTAWAGLFTFGIFAFVRVLYAPDAGGAGFARRTAYLTAMLTAYLVVAMGFWAWFRFARRSDTEAPAAET